MLRQSLRATKLRRNLWHSLMNFECWIMNFELIKSAGLLRWRSQWQFTCKSLRATKLRRNLWHSLMNFEYWIMNFELIKSEGLLRWRSQWQFTCKSLRHSESFDFIMNDCLANALNYEACKSHFEWCSLLDTLRYSKTEHQRFSSKTERSEVCIEKTTIGLLDTLRYSKTEH